ncbi:helix-turn-helix transcriptional regulator [Ferrovibrio sp. MS7]|uniref:helix-turn-helix domain-containing protein n=1 Tax=Ferrovibrio plantarum TaxID=3119164 RepID=UPI001B7A66E3|nr:helix-turn-helix transcriptional regulator [Ferrovibrio sp.]
MQTPPNYLKAWRLYSKLTLTEAAERADCTPSALSKLENSRLRVTDKWLHRLAAVYGRSPAALLSAPGLGADTDLVPGNIDPEDAAGVAKAWARLSPSHRTHLLGIIEAVATGDREEQAFLDADIHARDIGSALGLQLKAVQRLHLIERALKQRAEREATAGRTGVVVEQGLPENY